MKVSAENPTINCKVPHLLCGPEDIAEVVLLPGDPGRVTLFEKYCDDFRIVAKNREYTIGTGLYKGHRVTVCSTGIGAPSTEIAVLELIEIGAKALIRIGGTGALKEEIDCGDMIISTGAIRQGGASNFYAPPEYPAIASHEVVQCLIEACQAQGVRYHKGIGASIGSFFAGQGRRVLGKQFHDPELFNRMDTLNVINMEMEAETILTLGSIFNVMTGSICAVHANRKTNEWMVDFAGAQERMCKTALDAVVLLYDRYLK